MADIKSVRVTVVEPASGDARRADDGTNVKIQKGAPVKLEAAVDPADSEVKWSWTASASATPSSTSSTLEIPSFGDENVGSYVAVATASDDASRKKQSDPQRIELKTEDSPSSPPAVVEVEKGEFDANFAIATGSVLGLIALIGVALLVGNVSVDLPTLNADTAPKSGSYAERVRTVAVVTGLLAGVVALAAGIWLAALEVRGRLRKPEEAAGARVTLDTETIDPKAIGGVVEGAFKEGAKVLDAASKLRGTVAVLVVAALLLFGAMWTTGRPSENLSPSPTATETP